MTLVRRLAEELLQSHPSSAAAVLERLGPEATVAQLVRGATPRAAVVLQRLAPHTAIEVLHELAPERAAEILAELDVDTAVRLLRRVGSERRAQIVAHTDPARARSIEALLQFPEGSAGALMDPDVLALPQDLSAREALARVREAADRARYNLYVVDRDQRLVGVLNLRELLIARPRALLSDVMIRDPQAIRAHVDRAAILAHPGWREVHSLPVVDERGVYLGAIRYRALRELERARHRKGSPGDDTRAALGELFAAGASGLLEALTGRVPPDGESR